MGNLRHIRSMSKTARSPAKVSIGRNAQTGEFLGRAKDGTLIAKPDFKPVRFTVRELDRAIRAVRGRDDKALAG
jgi:hypothetical protein